MITGVDVVGVPSRDARRSAQFYVETLGLKRDERSWNEFWIGATCFAIWQPEQFGVEFQPQANSIALLHVDDVEAARAELESKGVVFDGETIETSVCKQAWFKDPDGNALMLHRRYAPFPDGRRPDA